MLKEEIGRVLSQLENVKANNMFLSSTRMALRKLFVREIYCSSDLF